MTKAEKMKLSTVTNQLVAHGWTQAQLSAMLDGLTYDDMIDCARSALQNEVGYDAKIKELSRAYSA